MTGPLRCVVFAGLLVACGDDTSTPGGDAAAGGGLVVAWSTLPATWPATLTSGVTVESATFAVDRLRVVGDAAPGDPRTTAGSFALRWDGTTTPSDLAFPDAPSGVYSQLSLLIDGHVAGPSIELRGHALVNATSYAYRVTDDTPFSVTLAIDETLRPPIVTRLGLRIDFQHALEMIDFSTVDNTTGRLELDNGDPQLATFRAKLMESFTIVN